MLKTMSGCAVDRAKALVASLAFGGIIALQAFLPALSLAASTACDTTNYTGFFLGGPDGKSTYAITQQRMTWGAAGSLAAASGGRLVVVANAQLNAALAQNLSSLFTPAPPPASGGNMAWIGLYDPLNTDIRCMEGNTCIPMPQRFSWAGGSGGFTNYSSGQPIDLCTNAEITVNPDHNCYGQPWIAMNTKGEWSAVGDHGAKPLTLPGLIEWPGTTLDCVSLDTPGQPDPVKKLPGSDTGTLWCTDSGKDNLEQCLVTTTTGQQLCPLQKVACNAVSSQPVCPANTTLNTTSHNCTAAAVINCPNGTSVSAGTCQAPSYKGCPTVYALNAAGTRCELAPPQCPGGGTYDEVLNKCDTVVQCASGTYNATTGQCQATAQCASGTLDTTTGQCVASSQCTTGTLDQTSNQCVGSTTYPATPVNVGGATFNFSAQITPSNTLVHCINNSCPKDTLYGYLALSSPTGGVPVCWDGLYFTPTDVNGCSIVGFLLKNSTSGVTLPVYADGVFLSSKASDTVLGYIAPASGTYGGTTTYTCNTGDTLSGTTCTQTTKTSPSCPSGMILASGGVCTAAPGCPSGMTPGNGVCQGAPGCPTGSSQSNGYCLYGNPSCPDGTFEDHGTSGDLCWAPFTTSCPTGTNYDATTGICTANGQVSCPNGTSYVLSAGDCEAVPICAQGVYNPALNGCSNGTQTCPLTNPSGTPYPCLQIQGDTTQATPGIPMEYCSPNNCQSDTSGMGNSNDTNSGVNDKKNDGVTDPKTGACLGQIYLFNGRDSRCRLYDDWGMLDSYAKLVASIVLACTGVGAALVGALVAEGLVTAGSAAASIITAVTDSAAQLAVNATLDEATGQQSSVSLLSAAATLIASGLAANVSGTTLPPVGGTCSYLTDSSGNYLDGILNNVGAIIQPSYDSALAQSIGNSSAFSEYMSQISSTVNQYAPAMSQAIMGNYGPQECCYPEKLTSACLSSEISEANLAANGACHIVGTYCASTLLFTCMTEKQTSCCFNSMLARIIQEQGRPYLANFGPSGGWGTPQLPFCRGFTPEEFQSIPLGSLDYSEYINSINKQIAKTLPKFQNYMNGMGSSMGQLLSASPNVPTGAQ